MRLSAPARRCFSVKHVATTLLVSSAKDKRWVSAESLRSFVVSAQSCGLVLRAARFHLRSLHDVSERAHTVTAALAAGQAAHTPSCIEYVTVEWPNGRAPAKPS